MEQLLKITTIPLMYEMKVTNARLERRHGSASMRIDRQRGGLHIQNQPSRIRIDTYDARNSVVPTTKTSIYQAADRGMQQAASATARYGQEARVLMKAQPGAGAQAIDQILANRTRLPAGEFQLAFLPTTGADISATEPSMMMRYQMDKLNFDWRISKGEVQFIPGDVEINITQYPDVQVEYIGEPVYVPPSAAERYAAEA